jgi:hypothetical protein
MGTPDAPLRIALFCLIFSLILAGGSLFFSFLKQGYGITTYGKIHRKLSSFALYTGIGAMTALIWHVSPLGGIVFFCLAVAMFVICVGFFIIVATGKHRERPVPGQTPGEAKE